MKVEAAQLQGIIIIYSVYPHPPTPIFSPPAQLPQFPLSPPPHCLWQDASKPSEA